MTSSTFGAGIHTDLPDTLVHLTGRPRVRADDLPAGFAQGGPDDRLAGIAHAGAIAATRVWRARGPVVCLSEASPAALMALFSTGVTYRGPYSPWTVMIDRAAAVAAGVRPVWHMGDDALAATESLPFLYHQYLQHSRRTAFVGFFLGYDFDNWLKGLPWDRAAALLLPDDKNYIARRKTNPKRRGGNNELFPVQVTPPEGMQCPIPIRDGGTVWQWQIDMLGNHKRFKLRPQPCACQISNCSHVRGIGYMYICDTSPFFQRSFMSVINPGDWPDDDPIVSTEEWNTLQRGKDNREDATLDEDMRYYNMLENEVQVRVMTRLDQGFRLTGIELAKKQWFGPGQPAGAWLAKEGHQARETKRPMACIA